MLIIEGSDCVGKTTLANELSRRLNYAYQHLGPLPDCWYDIDYVNLAAANSVRDRFHLSEIVYSTVLSRPVKIANLRLLHATLMLKYSAYTVIITADNSLLGPRHSSRDELFNLETVQAVNNMFSKLSYYADFRIHCTQDAPYFTEAHVDTIVQAYKDRIKALAAWKDLVRNLNS